MLISRKLVTILALGSLQSISLQSAVFARTRAQLPTAATLKKAITWKRAGIGACVLAFLAYKKYVKTDEQVYEEYVNLRGSANSESVDRHEKPERFALKRLHWYGRPRGFGPPARYIGVWWQDRRRYIVSARHNITQGWLFDTHQFIPIVCPESDLASELDPSHFGEDHSGSEEPYACAASAEDKKTAADAGEDEVPGENPRLKIEKARELFFQGYTIPGFSIQEYMPYAYGSRVEPIIRQSAQQLWCDGDDASRVAKIMAAVNSNKSPGSKNFTYIAITHGRVTGFITLRDNHIYLLAVDKDHQRRLIGRRMLCAAIDCLLHEGNKEITIDVQPDNEAALKLYRNCGFEFSGEQGAVPGLIRGRLNIKAYQDFRETVFPS